MGMNYSKGLPYRVYTAHITQAGTAAPVATVSESNTIGEIEWTRDGIGAYSATLSGVFLLEKTICFCTNNFLFDVQSASLGRTNDNVLQLYTFDSSGAPTDVFDVYVEIRVNL